MWREVSIEEALDESRLRMLISEEGLSRWGVIGGSHSGMLAVMNLTKALLQRDQSSMCIKQRESETPLVVSAYKSSLLYAERRSPVTPGGRAWTKHDGAGLKGPVAAWCRKHFGVGNSVSGEAPPLQGFEVTAAIPRDHTATCRVLRADVGRVALEEVLREQGIEAVVNATGFAAPSSLPAVTFESKPVDLAGAGSVLAPGLYGAGIAFPERYVDPEGDTGNRVGFGQNYADHVGRLLRAV